VVFDVDLTVHEGEIVGVLGHNGSGKTTTIRTILGLNPVIGGRIEFKGRDATRSNSRVNVKAGMAMIPSERFVFADLSVDDNLLLGAANDPDQDRRARRLELVRKLFPILVERSGQLTGTMSGGQQRMVSLGTALMASPTLLMLDEPSLGLAPAVVHQIFDTVRRLADEEGLAVLLLEQNVGQALRIVDRVYVMRSGRVILEESAEEMRNRDSYWELF
jgi:branched-chain amino acid transport system ATP-binding protein